MDKQSPINIVQQCHNGQSFDRLKFSILLNELTQSQFNEFCERVIHHADGDNPNARAERTDKFENQM